MLVLTRKLKEKIRIGDNITVSIQRISGNAVRVGIEAPRDVRVVRSELPPNVSLTNSNEGETRCGETAMTDEAVDSSSTVEFAASTEEAVAEPKSRRIHGRRPHTLVVAHAV